MAICNAKLAVAQQTPGESLGNSAALEERGHQLESEPYTVKCGDFRLLATTSLGFDWNNNINLSRDQALTDYIISPQLELDASYPLNSRNIIRFNIGVGYDKYIEHNEYSGIRLLSGSQILFDFYIKNFWIDLHDRFHYTRDTAGYPDIANTGFYGGFDNAAGLTATWDLEDVTLSVGYDHMNFISAASQFEYTDSATELISAQAGCRIDPHMTAGLEGSVSFTDYKQQVLNNNTGYNGGLYADWHPSTHSEVKLRGGYTFYDFRQTSMVIPAINEHSWYADLDLTHFVNDAFNYSLGAGHDLRLGIQADAVDAWHLRLGMNWEFIKTWSFAAAFSYENGTLGNSVVQGASAEHYEWSGFDFGLAHTLTGRLTLNINDRVTVRSSNIALREYTQNVVVIGLTYKL